MLLSQTHWFRQLLKSRITQAALFCLKPRRASEAPGYAALHGCEKNVGSVPHPPLKCKHDSQQSCARGSCCAKHFHLWCQYKPHGHTYTGKQTVAKQK
jgi:hypothetical protein